MDNRTHQGSNNYIDLKYNKSDVSNEKHEAYVDWLKNYLIPVVQKAVIFEWKAEKEERKNAASSPTKIDVKHVQEKITKSIDAEVDGTTKRSWTTSTESHDNRMVTLTIPCHDDDSNAFSISFDWE